MTLRAPTWRLRTLIQEASKRCCSSFLRYMTGIVRTMAWDRPKRLADQLQAKPVLSLAELNCYDIMLPLVVSKLPLRFCDKFWIILRAAEARTTQGSVHGSERRSGRKPKAPAGPGRHDARSPESGASGGTLKQVVQLGGATTGDGHGLGLVAVLRTGSQSGPPIATAESEAGEPSAPATPPHEEVLPVRQPRRTPRQTNDLTTHFPGFILIRHFAYFVH